MTHPLDFILKNAFSSLSDTIRQGWNGRREREVVSMFCFGHLVHLCKPDSFLHDPAQIGIEVPVPQNKTQQSLSGLSTSKLQVCKDIVIWSKARMTCWDESGLPTVSPACIIEWKHNEKDISRYDAEWLITFSSERPDFIGYVICTHDKSFSDFTLTCSRVSKGQLEHKWLHIV